MQLDIQITGLDKLHSKLSSLGEKELRYAKEKRLKESFLLLEKSAKEEAPRGSGKLRGSIQTEVKENGFSISTPLPYALFVHEGTQAHFIRPKTKKALYWEGALFPVKEVFHPGTKANPFFRRTIEKNESKIMKRFREILQEILDKA